MKKTPLPQAPRAGAGHHRGALVSGLLSAVLLAGACTSGTAGHGRSSATPAAKTATVAAFTPGPFGAEQIDADIRTLADWGVQTYETPNAVAPIRIATATRSPIRLVRSQVVQLGAGAAAGTGLTGANLDEIFRTATGVDVPMATLLAGYARGDRGLAPRLRALERIVDTARPAQAVFPTVLILAFVHDMVSVPHAPSPAASFADRGAPHQATAVNLCQAANNFFSDVLHKTFDGLKLGQLDTSGWAPIFKVFGDAVNAVTTVFNAVLSGAEFVVINGARLALEPIRRTLGSVAMLAAIAVQAATLVLPLDGAITIDRDPAYGVDGSPITFTATLATSTSAPTEWPTLITDCAKLIRGLELPELGLAGSAVEWEFSSTGATKTSAEPALVADGSRGIARLKFDTATEPREWHDKGAEATPVPGLIKATVQRKTKVLKDAVKAALAQAFSFLPEFLSARVVGFVSPQVEAALDKIVEFSDTPFSLAFDIAHHGPPQPTPSATPQRSEPAGGAAWVHVERPELPGARAGRIMDVTSCTGVAGPWTGKLRNGGIHADQLEIPWTDLPMTPFRITNGAGDTRASGIVTIPFPVVRSARTTYYLHVTITGNRMTVTGLPADAAPYFRNIPIQPAPAGRC